MLLHVEVDFMFTVAGLVASSGVVIISVTVTVGITDELFPAEPPNVEEDMFNTVITGDEVGCVPVDPEATAVAEGLRVKFVAIKTDESSDVTVSDTLLD